MKTNLSALEFIWALAIIFIISIITLIATGITLFALGMVLPLDVLLVVSALAGLFAGFYPIYYGLNYSCNYCSTFKE